MPDSQNPDHTRKIIQEFQLKGVNLVPTVTGEIVPTVKVADLVTDLDRYAVGTAFEAAVAGQQGVVKLFNAGSSGVLLLLDYILVRQSGGSNPIDVDLVLTAGGNAGAEAWRDGRLSGSPQGQVLSRTTATPGVSSIINWVSNNGIGTFTTSLLFPLGFVIDEAANVRVINGASNIDFGVTFFWRERDKGPND